jgi:hypothetical protein
LSFLGWGLSADFAGGPEVVVKIVVSHFYTLLMNISIDTSKELQKKQENYGKK